MIDLQAKFNTYRFQPRGVIHIGAHEGNELATYRSMGLKNILFIEANPVIYARLQQKMQGQTGIRTAWCAITDHSGECDLHVTSMDQGGSIPRLGKHSEIYPEIREVTTSRVPTKTLDDLMDELGLDLAAFDFINIDIPGAELLTLQGAPRTLAHIRAINSEVNFEGGALINDLELFLHERGFHRVAIVTPHHPSWGDALYLKRPVVSISTLGSNGRLANQLFQYAFLRIYAKKHGAIVQTAPWCGQKLFGVDDPPAQSILPRFEQSQPDADAWLLDGSRPPVLNVDIKGFFQIPSRYYLPYRDELLQIFKPVRALKSDLDHGIARIKAQWRTIVGIHIRRGDYGYNQFYAAPCVWFRLWLRQIWHRLDTPVLFLASDDLETVQRHFTDFPLITAKDFGMEIAGIEEYKDFYILTQCDALGISNSSFSFLAAMLNRQARTFVRADIETRGMIPFDPWNAPVIFNGYIEPRIHRELAEEDNLNLRNGYGVAPGNGTVMPIHFFTIVLNGEPFIRHHQEQFLQLPFRWHWHIIEGVAELNHDTAWSLPNGGRISGTFHDNGLSNDGTSSYLDQISRKYPENITVYRKPAGQFWDGKREMVNAPLATINEECLLWQVDADELWLAHSIEAMRELFIAYPQKTAAYFHCDYFVGPRKYVSSLNTWATYPTDWARAWRFRPGMTWSAHEPPIIIDREGRNPARLNPFTRDETMNKGIVFQHFAYATEAQVRFKEIYYGFKDAVAYWRRLQNTRGPVNPGDFLPWAKNDATVDDWSPTKGPLLLEPLLAPRRLPKSYASMSVDAATQFETELRTLFGKFRPSRIIETGTYLGQGTSSIIWRALRDLGINADFTTIEVNPEHHRLATAYFRAQGMNIRAELGVTVPRDMLPNKTEIADKFITNREYSGIYYDHDESVRADRYFSETNFDVADDLLFTAMRRVAFKPDFVLLDSAGHMGFIEFQCLMSLIQGDCLLMLDDVCHCKHFKTLQVIKQDPRFEILVESREKFGFCIARYSHVGSLLFIRTDLIGDNVLASSMLPYLRRQYHNATITALCQEQIAEIYAASPLVQRIISFNQDKAYKDEAYLNSILKQIQDLHVDICLNTVFSRTPLNDLFAVASGARILIGQEGDLCNISEERRARNNRYYTHLLPNSSEVKSEIGRHRDFLSGIGIETGELDLPFWVLPDDVDHVDRMFRESGFIPEKTIAFFAGAQDEIKRYDYYGVALAEICREQGFTVIALGSAKDSAINQLNLDATGVKSLNLCGATTIRQSGVIISRCRLAVGADTGLAHIACAVGTPNVILLGGWHWGRFLPYSPLTSVVSLPLECYGCNGRCRYPKAYCISGIAPETVAEAVRRTLAAPSGKPRLFAQNNDGWKPRGDEPKWAPPESILDTYAAIIPTGMSESMR